jgi:uncharacterized protein YecT (DUF1311 family)
MRSIWINAWLALALLGATPLVSAAGFDCGQAKSSVERQICGNTLLSRLDGQMTQVFAKARAKAGLHTDALLRDQHNWLGERDDVMMSNGSGGVAQEYMGRILFLEYVFDAPPANAPLLAAIVKHLVNQPSGAPMTLGGDGTVFKWAPEQSYASAKRLPFDTRSLIEMADKACVEPSDATLFLLDNFQLGGFYSSSFYMTGISSGDCANMGLFIWHGRAVQPITVPESLGEGITQTVSGGLVEFHSHAYALSSSKYSIAGSDIEAQQWDGKHWTWTDPARVMVRYDYRTSPQYMHCVLADCAKLTALARKALGRYVHGRNADTLAGQVPTDAQAQFETLQQQAGKSDSLKELPWPSYVPDSYISHGYRYEGFRGFDNINGSSVFFPIRWQGEWLLGRISRATEGYRSSDDVLLGIWRWDGDSFVPMLGMVASTQRAGFLLAAWLPPRSFQFKCEMSGGAGGCLDSQASHAAIATPAANALK